MNATRGLNVFLCADWLVSQWAEFYGGAAALFGGNRPNVVCYCWYLAGCVHLFTSGLQYADDLLEISTL